MAARQKQKARHTADPYEVRKAAETMPTKFLECRDMQHRWKPHTARFISKRDGYERVLRCDRCGTRRIQTVSSAGSITSSQYRHPEGYLLKDMGVLLGDSRDVIRLTSMLRTLKSARVLKAVG